MERACRFSGFKFKFKDNWWQHPRGWIFVSLCFSLIEHPNLIDYNSLALRHCM